MNLDGSVLSSFSSLIFWVGRRKMNIEENRNSRTRRYQFFGETLLAVFLSFHECLDLVNVVFMTYYLLICW